MGKGRGSIAFFRTYGPPVPLDIFCSPTSQPPPSGEGELLLTDGESYNQNGKIIPSAALSELLTFMGKSAEVEPEDAETGRVTGLLFVSEREMGLETLHVALRFDGDDGVKVLRLADIYVADTFGGARMEDSGYIVGGFTVGGRAVGQ